MSRLIFVSRFVLPALLLGLLLGVGAGLALAGQPNTQAPPLAGDEELLDGPDASQTQFFERVAGSSFRPPDSATEFDYGANGCLYRVGATGGNAFTYDLQLPQGAQINFLRLFFNDASLPDNIELDLVAFDNAGLTVLIEEIASTGWTGWGSTTSTTVSHVVDNGGWAYILWAAIPDGPESGLQLCGVSIGFEYSLATNYLPALLNLAAP